MRIAFVGDPDSDAARGASMAASEAKRAAQLLNVNFVFTRDTAGASAIVSRDSFTVDRAAFTVRSDRNNCMLWHHSLEKFGASQLNDRYRAEFKRDMTADAWAGWIAVKIVWEAALRAHSGENAAIRTFLTSPRATFDGHKGEPLRFVNGVLQQPLYKLDGDQVKACDVDS